MSYERVSYIRPNKMPPYKGSKKYVEILYYIISLLIIFVFEARQNSSYLKSYRISCGQFRASVSHWTLLAVAVAFPQIWKTEMFNIGINIMPRVKPHSATFRCHILENNQYSTHYNRYRYLSPFNGLDWKYGERLISECRKQVGTSLRGPHLSFLDRGWTQVGHRIDQPIYIWSYIVERLVDNR